MSLRRAAFLLLAVAACSAPATPSGPDASDAGTDAVVEAAPAPDVPEECKVVPGTVPPSEAECEPCKGRVFSEGASCADLTAGFQCEVGAHTAWYCNDVWECDTNLAWKRIVTAHTGDALCQTNLVAGLACNPYYGACPHPTGVPCLDSTKTSLCLFDQPWSSYVSNPPAKCLILDEGHTRFGCPCQHPDRFLGCAYTETCVSGRWKLGILPPCVGGG